MGRKRPILNGRYRPIADCRSDFTFLPLESFLFHLHVQCTDNSEKKRGFCVSCRSYIRKEGEMLMDLSRDAAKALLDAGIDATAALNSGVAAFI